MNAEPDQSQLHQARVALERGDYGQVIRMLSPAPQDPEALLLLATAQMGLGNSDAAVVICRRLRTCGDASLRAQARDLQQVLEAPSLKRPREWSLTLPELGASDAAMGRQLGRLSRQRRQQPPGPPPPAVGPTQAPLGFAVLVSLLVLLALALGGCGEVQSELAVVGAGRLQISHQFESGTGVLPSWQQHLSQQLQHQGWQQRRRGERTVLMAPPLPSRLALAQLGASISAACHLAGLTLPPPQLELHSRNWVLAVDERIGLQLDLRELPDWATPQMTLILVGVRINDVSGAAPAAVEPLPGRSGPALQWTLQGGADNRLALHLWHWNPLGLGTVVVLALLVLSLVLQQLRRQLGYGLPELPR